MEIIGKQVIPVPRDVVWAALNNPEVLKACLPGCESVELTAPNEFKVAIKTVIGPLRARFQGSLRMSEVDAPSSCLMHFEGQGGAVGFGKGSANVALRDTPEALRPRKRRQLRRASRHRKPSAQHHGISKKAGHSHIQINSSTSLTRASASRESPPSPATSRPTIHRTLVISHYSLVISPWSLVLPPLRRSCRQRMTRPGQITVRDLRHALQRKD